MLVYLCTISVSLAVYLVYVGYDELTVTLYDLGHGDLLCCQFSS